MIDVFKWGLGLFLSKEESKLIRNTEGGVDPTERDQFYCSYGPVGPYPSPLSSSVDCFKSKLSSVLSMFSFDVAFG